MIEESTNIIFVIIELIENGFSETVTKDYYSKRDVRPIFFMSSIYTFWCNFIQPRSFLFYRTNNRERERGKGEEEGEREWSNIFTK